MNKKDAIQAMLEGKFVRHPTMDEYEYARINSDTDFVDNEENYIELNCYSPEGWSLYLKEPIKRKFYRRKWRMCKDGTRLLTEDMWYSSIEEYDKAHDYFELSPEIETMEV